MIRSSIVGSISRGKPRRIRIGVLGAARSSKTTLISRIVYKSFNESYIPTIEDLHTMYVDLEKETSKRIEFLDTAGAYSFPAMRRLAIDTCHMFMIVYAVDDPNSLHQAMNLHKEIAGIKTAPVVIVGNKIDLNQQRAGIGEKQLSELTDNPSISTADLLTASAKQDLHVEDVFRQLLSHSSSPP